MVVSDGPSSPPLGGRRPGSLSAWLSGSGWAELAGRSELGGPPVSHQLGQRAEVVLLLGRFCRASGPGGKQWVQNYFFHACFFFFPSDSAKVSHSRQQLEHQRQRRRRVFLRSPAGPAKASGSSVSFRSSPHLCLPKRAPGPSFPASPGRPGEVET